jgi:hypothetical protein
VSSPVDITQLAAQARAAFDQKRMRDCVALANALAKADPDNPDAREFQSVIQAGIARDLNDVRDLLVESRSTDEGQKFRKAAEIILLKVLYIDPAHEEAKELLASTRALATTPTGAGAEVIPASPKPTVAAPAPITEPTPLVKMPAASGDSHEEAAKKFAQALSHAAMETATPTVPASASMPVTPPNPATSASSARDQEIAFTTGVQRAPRKEEKKRSPLPFVLVSVVLVGIVLLLVGSRMAKPLAPEEPTAPAAAVRHASPSSDAVPVKEPVAPQEDIVPPVSSQAATPPPEAPVAPTPVAPAAAPATPAPVPPVRVEPLVQTGTLALSSSVVAEIYLGQKRVGSTPTTLTLPQGRQTLEYRYKNRSAVVSYEIKANQTTTAWVTFETTVQINAKPWAEVAVEGAPRRSLGETPLSNVRVPIGSVLVFENPNFPSKTQTHRVTDDDTAIQVVFQ